MDSRARAGPPNKSARIGFVQKSLHHSRRAAGPTGEAKGDKTGGRPINSDPSVKVNAPSSERPRGRSAASRSVSPAERQKRPQKEELKWRGRIIEQRQGAAFDSAGGRTV